MRPTTNNKWRSRWMLRLMAPVCFAGLAAAQQPAAGNSSASGIWYTDGKLKIEAANATLGAVLSQVAALTGVRIDVPPGAEGKPMPVVKFGPGPARQVLATLLSSADVDYVIQGSDADGEKIQSVLILPPGDKGRSNDLEPPSATPARSIYARATEPSVAAPAPAEDPAGTSAAGSPPPPSSDAAAPDPSPAAPTIPAGLTPALQTDPMNPTKGALPVPTVMNQQTFNQQLQDMYQQRMQMIQQQRQTTAH